MKKARIVLCCLLLGLVAACVAACNDGKTSQSEYTVTFDVAGGSNVEAQTVKNGETAMQPEDPTRIGWTFGGWYHGNTQYAFDEQVTENITLTARWSSVLGGAGTAGNPFTIDTAEELTALGGFLAVGASEMQTAYYVQTANITSALTSPMAEFSGVYDGGKFAVTTAVPLFGTLSGRVKNLTVKGNLEYEGEFAGLLACVARNAVISGVQAEGNVTASGTAGALVGKLESGRIEYVTVTADVSGSIAGGIAGENNGTVINGSASGTVTASVSGGGAAGILSSEGLVQNFGFGGSVSAVNRAGGIAGEKKNGSSVYRGFVYGDGTIAAAYAGGIAGKQEFDLRTYEDVLSCMVRNSVRVEASVAARVYEGERLIYADNTLSTLGLPAQVWVMRNNLPTLRATMQELPATVRLTVDGGEAQDVPYASHVTGELFTTDYAHFSSRNELDGAQTLMTVSVSPSALTDFVFIDGYAQLAFTADGATITQSQGATPQTLTYVTAHVTRGVYEYPTTAGTETRTYAAPYYVYTDGENDYAFFVDKAYTFAGFIGQLLSYECGESGLRGSRLWDPKTDIFYGAHTYVTGGFLSQTRHNVVIDASYTVEEDGNDVAVYRRTKYFVGTNQDNYIMGRGDTFLFLGDDVNATAYKPAFGFEVTRAQEIDFIYFNDEGVLTSGVDGAALSPLFGLFDGVWYAADGTKWRLDAEEKTVTVGDGAVVTYTEATDGSYISFTYGNTPYRFSVAPTEYGAYKLVSQNGAQFSVASYVDDALLGKWILPNGDTLLVSSTGTTTSIHYAGAEATDVRETVYNDMQAVHFSAGGKTYDLVVYADGAVAVLFGDGKKEYAMHDEVLREKFLGDFVTVAGGQKIELTVDENYDVTYRAAGESAQTGKLLPTFADIGGAHVYGASVTIGNTEYAVIRTYDVLQLASDDTVYAFTDSAYFDLFTVTYTNGAEMLEITQDGRFARYARGGTATTYTPLTAVYSENRAEYGMENRGFVLSYTENNDTYFFYADSDAPNVRLFRVVVGTDGTVSPQGMNNFVPQNELQPMSGEYVGQYNNAPDTMTFTEDGLLTRTYSDASGKVQSVNIDWYPLLNYNYNSETWKIMAYTIEIGSDGMKFESSVNFNPLGFTWGTSGSYIEKKVAETFMPFLEYVYQSDDHTMLTVSSTQIKLRAHDGKTTQFNFDTVAVQDGIVHVALTESAWGVAGPRSATAVLSVIGGTYRIDWTVGEDAAKAFVGEEMLDYHTLVGEYVHGDTTYTFVVESSWFTSISLRIREGSTTRSYYYSESDGVYFTTDGHQAIGVTLRTTYATKYIWKVGNSLMVSDSLDASKAIEAVDSAVAGMPAMEALKELLNGAEFTAQDGASVTFHNVTGGGVGMAYFEIVDGDVSSYFESYTRTKGMYALYFEGDLTEEDRYVNVYFNDDNAIVKISVSDTEDGEYKEYTPVVVFPTVAELIEWLKGTAYKAADNRTIVFTESANGGYLIAEIGGSEYIGASGSVAENVYTLACGDFLGTATVTVTLSATAQIEKVTYDGVEYLPVAMPTIEELTAMLTGKTYRSKTNADEAVTFSVESGKLTVNGLNFLERSILAKNEYTLEFKGYIGAGYTVNVVFSPLGEIETVSVDGQEYVLA